MSVPPREAADRLREIERAQQHSATAYRYARAAPHLILWGAIWIVGYAACYTLPWASVIWLVLIVLGASGDIWIARRATAPSGHGGYRRRYLVTLLAALGFIAAWTAILPPTSGLQISAMIPILIGFAYLIVGVWTRMLRMALLGVALGALTLAGYFWLPGVFLLWMAGVGGGALILGGAWLRRA